MEIGKPQRVVRVEPLVDPVPPREAPVEVLPAPPQPTPAAPAK